MFDTVFTHNDPDEYHDRELTLHDCIAKKILYKDGILHSYFEDGFWITHNHKENSLGKTVRTDASQADFCIEDINDIDIQVYTKNILKKTTVELWNINDLISAVNSGKCTIEFIYQYRSSFKQLWECALHFKKKPYYRQCQLHLPGANATYRWNNMRADREW